jgi:hypothetical protein
MNLDHDRATCLWAANAGRRFAAMKQRTAWLSAQPVTYEVKYIGWPLLRRQISTPRRRKKLLVDE